MTDPDTAEAVTRLAREEGGRVTAILAHRYADLDLADESVQDALVEALGTWPTRGVPDNPAAWLLTATRPSTGCVVRRAPRAAPAPWPLT